MSKIIAIMSLALAAGTVSASPNKLAPHTPLITSGAVQVDSTDFEGNMLRIPENRRDEVRMSYDRVATIVDNMFVTRVVAAKAREAGLHKDPAVQKRLQQVQEGVLAELYVQKIEKEAAGVNLEQRARELYKAEQAKFMTPEEVHIQHILVNLNGRTRETALERAKQAAAEAKAGEDFLALATRYSDDPDKKRNGGDLGYSSPTSFTEPVRKAIATLKTKGEIAGPVESEFGFHVVRFVDRKAPKPIPFEAVRKQIIQAETERLMKQRREALLQEVRSPANVTVHRQNIEQLVVKMDPADVRRSLEEASAKTVAK
ncbi:MAG TPA: peptidylprolyl isomerase [Usitatibacter sp.]|nr:peptidylprolyl isomerase [Usitatibacter sp.]